MTTYAYGRGDTAELEARFYEYPGGPLVDVTDLTIAITNIDDEVVLAATSVGIVHVTTGVYAYSWPVPVDAVLGYHVVTWAAVETSAVDTLTITDAGVDVVSLKTYLKIDLDDESQDVELLDALDAERAAQGRVCRVPVTYPADLAQALKRRCARNLALRGLPIMVLRGDAESGSLVPPGRDAEVRRLEGPFRKLVVG